ncbi:MULTISPECIES: GNAT family N-acetyltransferase [Vibrio harveyi group]|uniref:GNAT family N-acetyltransferase n=1 Tax=Vibrio harveyi group TaxID=717610 RepID=UPI00211B1D05|nr:MULTISPECIES: GNAT family N-acetyltransferase [Vibrio harveyi group]EJV0279273.1 GNAT family N-acetyltransferase [Vibrio parahaemolyticus]EKZ9072640.1 GNAT family N-acetyltransferase [Vibrio parahaemolyticus]MCG6238908.1 GNAT family N-acetyltransferase [Vibrio diabolicus]MCR9347852.1 GNAT family N-acetyltransferase [Vibrio alginolyticus]MCR9415737.1 GNAT family N-acetyltransferase [Vibrio alginolyticus]
MKIEHLDKNIHDRNGFDCGEPALNNYLKATSGQHSKKDLSRTFVLTSSGNPSQIKGFYSLALCTVELYELPPSIAKKYPAAIHCALIGRLAVNNSHKRQGLGSILLIDAIRKAIESSKAIPTPMVIVDAKNAVAKSMYMDLGFEPFPNQQDRLFMTTAMAVAMLKKVDSEP